MSIMESVRQNVCCFSDPDPNHLSDKVRARIEKERIQNAVSDEDVDMEDIDFGANLPDDEIMLDIEDAMEVDNAENVNEPMEVED
jgi:hypothetical protein